MPYEMPPCPLHDALATAGFDVLLFDEKSRLGAILADIDLIGIPHRLVIGERGLKENKVEYKRRTDVESQDITIDQVVEFLQGHRENT